jgi:serine protease AprX
MIRRRSIQLLLAIAVLTTAIGLGLALGKEPADSWESKVDSALIQQTQSGESTDCIVFLAEQADLSLAASLPTKLEKGRYVYEALTATAQRTQGGVIKALVQQRAQYRPYWVANMIWVRGGLDTLQSMASRLDVARIYANPAVRLQEPIREEELENPLSPDTIEWNINRVNAPAVWDAGFSGQGAVVGGQDTGYQWDHPALKTQYRGWNGTTASHDYNWHDAIHSGSGPCGADSAAPCDDYGHGTHTMGTMVGGDGATNQIGMAPGARWIGCRNMNLGNGTPTTYSECYQWFIAPTKVDGSSPDPSMAPDVVNNSWSCTTSEGCTDSNVLVTVVNNVRAAGIVTVHSAGNSGPGCGSINTPAAIYDSSLTVGSTDSNDVIASSSSRGPVTVDGSGRRKPNISAPGANVRSSVPASTYENMSGTSMAAPHVAGLVALLISANPTLAGQVDTLERTIEWTALPRTSTSQTCGGDNSTGVPNNVYGWGRIDALAGHNSTQVSGALQVTLVPESLAGGQWRVGGGSYQNSGATVSNLNSGPHNLEFAPVIGWIKPSSQTVIVIGGYVTQASGTYMRQGGSLKVTISPRSAIDAGARWSVDSGDWNSSGDVVPDLSEGAHVLNFRATSGWITPEGQTVNVAAGLTTASGTYRQLPVVSVVATDPSASETGKDYGRFKISRVGDRNASLVVSYKLQGSAVNGKDYRKLPTQATIPRGKSSVSVTVVPIDDHVRERTKSVVLKIIGASSYTAGSPRKATVTIKDPN